MGALSALESADEDAARTLMAPCAGHQRLDVAALHIRLGATAPEPEEVELLLDRLRRADAAPETDVAAEQILHRDKVEDDGYSIALKPFSTRPFPTVKVIRDGRRLLYTLPGDEGGSYEELTLLFASIERDAMPCYRCEKQPSAYLGFIPRNPSKHLLLDMFIHESAWQGVEPRLEMTRNDSALVSSVAPMDRFDFCERIQSLGTSPSTRAARWMPRYTGLLDWVYASQEWNPEEFRLYRFAVKYPVIGLRYMVYFDLPEAPGASS